jgi:hypothetical protein
MWCLAWDFLAVDADSNRRQQSVGWAQCFFWVGVPQPDAVGNPGEVGKVGGLCRWDGSGGFVQHPRGRRRCQEGADRVGVRPGCAARTGRVSACWEQSAGHIESTRGRVRDESDYFLRCRILARFRRFLRPILRRPLPDFFVPMWLFARNTLVGHGDRMAMLAKGDSSRTGDVEQLRRAMHCRGPDGGKRRVGSLSCAASECAGHGDRLERRGRS